MKFAKIVIPTYVAAMVALAGTAHADPSAKPVKLIYAGYITRGGTATQLDEWFMQEVSRRTNGRVTFEAYYSGSLLNAADLYPGLSRGAADIVTGTPQAYNPQEYPLSSIVVPYLTDKADAVTYAFNDLYKNNADFRKEFEGKGVEMLWAAAFPETGVWSNKKVGSIADLKGMRIRSALGIAQAFEILGATPVAMTFTEGVDALKRGAIDGMSSAPFDSAVGVGLPKVAAFVSDAGRMGINSVSIASINKRKLDSLDPEARKVILDLAGEMPKKYAEVVDKKIQQSAEKFAAEAGDITVITTPEKEVEAWRAKTADKLKAEWLQLAGKRTKNAEAMFQQYVELVRKYEKASTYKPGLDRFEDLKGKK
ncbi:MAG TPA: TRAP transporter substrate-binding protein DctP [Hyphomicrobiaceae bacterium]